MKFHIGFPIYRSGPPLFYLVYASTSWNNHCVGEPDKDPCDPAKRLPLSSGAQKCTEWYPQTNKKFLFKPFGVEIRSAAEIRVDMYCEDSDSVACALAWCAPEGHFDHTDQTGPIILISIAFDGIPENGFQNAKLKRVTDEKDKEGAIASLKNKWRAAIKANELGRPTALVLHEEDYKLLTEGLDDNPGLSPEEYHGGRIEDLSSIAENYEKNGGKPWLISAGEDDFAWLADALDIDHVELLPESEKAAEKKRRFDLYIGRCKDRTLPELLFDEKEINVYRNRIREQEYELKRDKVLLHKIIRGIPLSDEETSRWKTFEEEERIERERKEVWWDNESAIDMLEYTIEWAQEEIEDMKVAYAIGRWPQKVLDDFQKRAEKCLNFYTEDGELIPPSLEETELVMQTIYDKARYCIVEYPCLLKVPYDLLDKQIEDYDYSGIPSTKGKRYLFPEILGTLNGLRDIDLRRAQEWAEKFISLCKNPPHDWRCSTVSSKWKKMWKELERQLGSFLKTISGRTKPYSTKTAASS